MIIYKYDPDTGEYTGQMEARIDPLESDLAGEPVYLQTANTTLIPPDIAGTNEDVIFNGTSWQIVEDRRGTVVYNKITRQVETISELGPIPDAVTTDQPSAYATTHDGVSWQINTTIQTIDGIKNNLKENDRFLFRLILEIFQIGKDKGLWANADVDSLLLTKAADIKQKLDELDAVDPPV